MPESESQREPKTKLEIREEVERRFGNPPKTFVDLVESEVEKRIEHRVKNYRILSSVVILLVGAFAVILWKVSLATVKDTVVKQLAEQEVIKTKERILAISLIAEDANQSISNISVSLNTNYGPFLARLVEIKRQDNVVTTEDLSKLFVLQVVTNFMDGNKIPLDYEPITSTVQLMAQDMSQGGISVMTVPGIAVEGKTLILPKTGGAIGTLNSIFTNAARMTQYQINVAYVRKSLR